MSNPPVGPVPVSADALAWLAIACAAALAVWLVIFSFRHLGHLGGVLVGFFVAVAGAWWLITERAASALDRARRRRVVGLVDPRRRAGGRWRRHRLPGDPRRSGRCSSSR